MEFRNKLGEQIFYAKYAQGINDTWSALASRVVMDVCAPYLSNDECDTIEELIRTFKFIPGGRYLYYAGREAKFWNNCYLLRAEQDTREEWAELAWRSTSALMSGGGIGIDYSRLRGKGELLARTGGTASGPIPLMHAINEIGRNVMQGGSRRSAIYASLDWNHSDVLSFLEAKNWHDKHLFVDGPSYANVKEANFNGHAPLDMTNISVNYNDAFLDAYNSGDSHAIAVWEANVRQALTTGEPGFSFNFHGKENETLRNACTEVTSEDDSDVCNLGSVNLAACDGISDIAVASNYGSRFLACGLKGADLPYEKVHEVRKSNSRVGLGLMGVHEYLLKQGKRYEVDDDFKRVLSTWSTHGERGANGVCDRLNIVRPVAYRAIAPTGTIGILAGTTTGIEPLYSVAYKRRFLTEGTKWNATYVVDSVAEDLINRYGITEPDNIESAIDLAYDYERRIKFQAEVQEYVDMAISSTINLPPASSTYVRGLVESGDFAKTLLEYAPKLRGFTCYPDGARGGQPIESVPYATAIESKGVVFEEHDICSITGHGGHCGV